MENAILQQAQVVEQQLDQEIDRLQNLDETDLDRIRKNRIEEMKRGALAKSEWEKNGKKTNLVLTCKAFLNLIC